MIICTLFHVLNNLIVIKKTTGIWCLQWCSISGRAVQKTRDQNPTVRGRNKWAEMHQLLLWCKLSAECRVHVLPKKCSDSSEMEAWDPEDSLWNPVLPSCKAFYLKERKQNIRKESLTAGLRTDITDFCSHQYPFIVHPKRTLHIFNCFL